MSCSRRRHLKNEFGTAKRNVSNLITSTQLAVVIDCSNVDENVCDLQCIDALSRALTEVGWLANTNFAMRISFEDCFPMNVEL